MLIVGGGPIGLALSAELGRRGVHTLLVDAGPEPDGVLRPSTAKMIGVSVRTMEFCRQLGIAGQVRDWGFPLDHGLDSLFVTSVAGYELGRIPTPSLADERDTDVSPERDRPCPQTWFDPILRDHAQSTGHVELRYAARLVSFVQNEQSVLSSLIGPDGPFEIRSQYLVGCDGFVSTVRELLGIEVRGERRLDLSMSVYVTIPDLARIHDKGLVYRFTIVGPQGVWAVLTTIDGRDLYRLQLISVPGGEPDMAWLKAAVRETLGADIPFQIAEVSSWERKMTIADRFSDGRVFIAGDAAHAHPPNGGLGMNTGIPDAWDLGWKLAAVLQGWGGPTLLDSYDVERRPACSRAAQESLKNFRRLTNHPRYPDILEDTDAGRESRRVLGVRLVEENERSWHPVGVHLGYLAFPSPVVADDGSPVPADDTYGYTPSSRPGGRAPHAWVEPDFSTLDWFGPGFTLLDFGGEGAGDIAAAARSCSLPLQVVQCADEEIARLYERRLVLVRPDGYVAWRGDAAPVDAMALVNTVRGAGPSIAARRQDQSGLEAVSP